MGNESSYCSMHLQLWLESSTDIINKLANVCIARQFWCVCQDLTFVRSNTGRTLFIDWKSKDLDTLVLYLKY
jgi:hypothetical protein